MDRRSSYSSQRMETIFLTIVSDGVSIAFPILLFAGKFMVGPKYPTVNLHGLFLLTLGLRL